MFEPPRRGDAEKLRTYFSSRPFGLSDTGTNSPFLKNFLRVFASLR